MTWPARANSTRTTCRRRWSRSERAIGAARTSGSGTTRRRTSASSSSRKWKRKSTRAGSRRTSTSSCESSGQFGESVGSVNAYQLASPFLLVSKKRAAVVTSTKPRVILPAEEVKRLKRVLAEAPGPMNLDRTTYEIFRGPSRSRLHWTSNGDAAWEKLLRDAVPLIGPALLRTDLHCYELRVAEDRLLLWRQIRLAPPGGVLRLSFFDTTSLRPIGRRSKRRPGDPIVHESGLLAEVDLPGDWDAGVRRVDFPEVMAGVARLLSLCHGIPRWKPGPP